MTQINSFRDLVTRVRPIPNPTSLVTAIGNGLVAATMAPSCAVCDVVLDEPLSGCVCRRCWRAIRPITPPACDGCGEPLPRPVRRCGVCRRQDRFVRRARTIGEYDGTLRDIIHAFKYQGRRSLARPLAALMRARGAELLDEADCVVPVPLHWRRQHSRGFNQARELARHLGLPVIDALVRRRHTRAQVELTADRRRANVAGAFCARRRWLRHPDLRGMNVLLIDDVSTTGATLESCAQAIKECGASDVGALTAARVLTTWRRDQNSSQIPSPDSLGSGDPSLQRPPAR